MQRASEKIDQVCRLSNIPVRVTIHNLWQSVHLDPRADLVIQMFPFFERLECPLLDGRPFISGIGEAVLLDKLIRILDPE